MTAIHLIGGPRQTDGSYVPEWWFSNHKMPILWAGGMPCVIHHTGYYERYSTTRTAIWVGWQD